MSGSASTARGTRVEIQHLAGRQNGEGLLMKASNEWRLIQVGRKEREERRNQEAAGPINTE